MQLRDLFDELPVAGSGVIPLAMQQLLREDLDVASDWHGAEQLLLRARQALPEQLEIMVALYKLYAYSNRFDEALRIIDQVLEQAAGMAGFDCDWRRLTADSADWHNAKGAVRVYLYSLKATGFVRLRRGDIRIAYDVLCKLVQLDPQDQVGGSVVLDMAERVMEPA